MYSSRVKSSVFKNVYTYKSLICRHLNGKIDYSKVPKLSEGELEEKFISGSGPGGQNVNKAVNCVFLRHVPTGVFVKVHQARELHRNREIARQLLTYKLDDLINGENSVSAQKKRLSEEKRSKTEKKSAKLRDLKKQFKQSNCENS
ncbi:Zinc finger BED domain-containing protein 5-like protein [Dinothrombium tinctorium]|uniref:Zinc finger BED domain-containing protein 5-like protein n=1 Tax=Dinothrombium tinctorium TaxID=1965070 RepID=A0A3S3S2L0_9ACAR|nr:Zinc finger BED domain-containing protein 5-like protein [Dinothrombium tinctorium]RWS15178.1 Zinc finger BED domain-containing protein 5-like protein [Dinothrombium tinctorium]RWS15192.1 Zinc finger BED domain-containing protein 5-like protein [Dinothrombium tinctorium]